MITKRRAARLAEPQLTRDRAAAFYDARALAIELGRGRSSMAFDPMTARVVLRSNEVPYRQLTVWLFAFDRGEWAAPSPAAVLITNRRLLVRFSCNRLVSLPWTGLLGLQIDLPAETVTLDYGDGRPIALSGPATPLVAVASVAFVYGVRALLTHPALARLRETRGSRH